MNALLQEFRNTVVGRHYRDWAAIGAAAAVVGFTLALFSRRNRSGL